MNPLDPFAMRTAFPPSDYYGSSAPRTTVSRRCAVPPDGGRMPPSGGSRARFPRSPRADRQV